MFKTNKNRPIIGNGEIVEWDMKSGNTSICRAFQLLPNNKIEILEGMKKKDRVVAIGKLMRNDKDFSKRLEAGFDLAIYKFLEENQLDDFDVLSIKRDAVFVVNHDIKVNNFYCDTVHFEKKNVYHGVMIFGQTEIYFGDDKVDVKGINDDLIPLHNNGMLDFLKTILDLYERGDKEELHEYLAKFIVAYRKKELILDYYREFNAESMYAVIYNQKDRVLQDIVPEEDIDKVDFMYNYTKIIMPILQMLI